MQDQRGVAWGRGFNMERMLEVFLGRDSSSDEEQAPLLENEELENGELETEEELEEAGAGAGQPCSDGSSDAGGEERPMETGEAEKEEASAAQKKEKKSKKRGKTEFDISLPARHLYLGELEEDGPANMEDEETTPTLPLLCIPSRILFPGETLPMHIYNPHMIQMLRDASTRGKPVAICTDLRLRYRQQHLGHAQQPRPAQEELSEIGTTAEVVAFKEEESQYFVGQCFVVKFLGRQRYRLLELHRKVNGLMDCRVEILPEQYLPPSPTVLTSSCPAHVHASCRATQLLARQPDCTMHTYRQLERCRKRLQHPYVSCLSPIPRWVFTRYNTDFLREQLMMEQELKTFRSEDPTSSKLPSDISSLSYWLARRLPTDETKKLELLSIDCPTLRLIRGLQLLREFTDLCCSSCLAVIARKQHMFSMSVDGPLAAYVNPGGYVHDTLTVTEAKGLRRQGSSSTEHSWFPGYKWTILNCRGCGHHKGWCFEATKRNLLPKRFYGLTRDGLVLTSAREPQDTAR